jgi:hypothetical protein
MLALSSSLALAFAPTDAVHEGIEPERLQVTHPGEQARLLASPAWRRFVEGDGAGWTAIFDEATGVPRWAWGRGLPVDTRSDDALVRDVSALVARHADLFGTRAADLRARSVRAEGDTVYVELAALREGLDTFRGGVSARIVKGRLVAIKVTTAPRAPVEGRVATTAAEATAAAIAQGPASSAHHTRSGAELLLLERKSLDGFVLRPVWQVTSRTAEPPGRWVSLVDAETGALLEVWNEIRFASGTVSGRHHRRTVDGSALVTSPMPGQIVRAGGASDVTDAQGGFTLNAGGPYATDFDGDFLTIYNAAGAEGALADSGTSLEWTTADASQAEIDTWKFLHDAKAWGDVYAPTVSWVANPILATVNLGQTCNAYWDGDLNFFSSGGGCNNTGQIADVVYHEWGHGFHYESIRAGSFNGSVSEGAGDTVSILLTQDANMSPYFDIGNPTGIRNLAPDRVYPRDVVGEVHEDGLIFGGAMWDLLQLLQDDLGEEAGTAAASEIFAGLLRGGPSLPDTFEEALVADDDDGDLQNGTPHVCQITEAFGRHGLGTSNGAAGVLPTMAQQVRVDAQVDIPVAVELVSVAAGCEAVQAEQGTLHFRVDGGSWQTASMSVTGIDVKGSIPGQPAGSIVEYYVTGQADGEDFEAPIGGPIRPYTTYVGEVIEVHCDDFEQGDGGYTHTLVAGTAQDGADDWQWGTPNGRSGDPVGAYSGNKVWGNDLGHDEFNGAYQPDKHNRLTSASVDTRWYTGVFLQYRRWLGVEDRTFDHAAISIGGDILWENWGSARGEDQHVDGEWVSHVVDLRGKADQRQTKVSFDLRTDGGLEFGGWTIDDVCFVAPATTDNKMGIDDLRIEALDDTTAGLSFTTPRHGPVEKLRIVRRVDRLPKSADDGQIAYEAEDVRPGAPFSLEDPNYHPGVTYYAVYGFDGDGWLSWTRDGWNAGSVALVGGAPPEGVVTEDGMVVSEEDSYRRMGCGCDGAGASGAGVALALLPFLRRRRR